jgi:hypothetical protein
MKNPFRGAWKKVRDWLGGVEEEKVNDIVVDEMALLGAVIVRRVQGHIQAQDLPWAPLAPITIKKKGFSDIYIEKGDYMVNIVTELEKRKSRTILRVGPSKLIARKGLTFQELATYLEYGTSRMPARPVWNPVFREVKKLTLWEELMKKVTVDF